METFDSNTLATFCKFLTTKVPNIVDGKLNVSNSKANKDSQKMSSGANVNSRPYGGQHFGFMPGTVDTMAQRLATFEITIGLPYCCFRELMSSGKHEFFNGKFEGFTISGEEIPSIIGFKGNLDGNELYIGNKMITYGRQNFGFMLGTFDTVAQRLATIEITFGLPYCSFRDLLSSGKYEFFTASLRDLQFPGRKFRASLDLKVTLTAMNYILGTK